MEAVLSPPFAGPRPDVLTVGQQWTGHCAHPASRTEDLHGTLWNQRQGLQRHLRPDAATHIGPGDLLPTLGSHDPNDQGAGGGWGSSNSTAQPFPRGDHKNWRDTLFSGMPSSEGSGVALSLSHPCQALGPACSAGSTCLLCSLRTSLCRIRGGH